MKRVNLEFLSNFCRTDFRSQDEIKLSNFLTEVANQRPVKKSDWEPVQTAAGIFYYNRKTKQWMNNFGTILENIDELVRVSMMYESTDDANSRERKVTPVYAVYVSNSIGNDSWSGSSNYIDGTNGPLRTLSKASELIKSYSGPLNVEVRVMSGTYSIMGTVDYPAFYLDASNSGTVTKSITYKRATTQDTVIFTGDQQIPYTAFSKITASDPMWSKLSGNPTAQNSVYVADVSAYDLGQFPPHWQMYRWAVQGEKEFWGGLPSVPDLIFNDSQMTLSRWPNISGSTGTGFSFEETAHIGGLTTDVVNEGTNSVRFNNPDYGGVNGIFKYPSDYDSVISKWNVADGIWLLMFSKYDYGEEYYKIVGLNKTSREITVRSKNSRFGIINNTTCYGGTYADYNLRRWFAQNVPYELTSGEYYIDRTTNKLYFYPPSTINSSSTISLSHRALAGCGSIYDSVNDTVDAETGYNLQTSVPDSGQTYNFKYPGWTGMDPSIGYDAVGGSIQSRHIENTKNGILSMFKFFRLQNVTVDGFIFKNCAGSGIQMDLCKNVTIKNCEFYNMKYHGINSMGGRGITIDNCNIHDIGLSGVICTGGNLQNLTSSGNIVTNSRFIRCTKSNPSESQAVLIAGVGNTVSKNLFRDNGICVQMNGMNSTVEYNHFYANIRDVEDFGVIYAYRDYLSAGNSIRYNFFNDNGSSLPGGTAYHTRLFVGDQQGCTGGLHQITSDIYLDGYISGYSIYQNIFYKSRNFGQSVFINGGVRNEVTNNIFINSQGDSIRFDSYFGSVILSQLIQSKKNFILNPFGYVFYENGGDGENPITEGYNCWNYYASFHGRDRFNGGIQSLMVTADIRSSYYVSPYPWLASDLTITSGGFITDFSDFNSYKNLKVQSNNNVLINHGGIFVPDKSLDTPEGSGLDKYVGGITESNTKSYSSVSSFNGFVDPNNLNFKLTSSGLSNIRQSIPNFQDIPFENIPTL